MNEPYKFGNHNASELLEKGRDRFGSPKTNSCDCPKCYGGGRYGMFACENCKGTGQIQNSKGKKVFKTEAEANKYADHLENQDYKDIHVYETGNTYTVEYEQGQRNNDSDDQEVLEHQEDEQCEGGSPVKTKKKMGPYFEGGEKAK